MVLIRQVQGLVIQMRPAKTPAVAPNRRRVTAPTAPAVSTPYRASTSLPPTAPRYQSSRTIIDHSVSISVAKGKLV